MNKSLKYISIILVVGVVIIPLAAEAESPVIPTGVCPEYKRFDGRECVERCDIDKDFYWDKSQGRCISVHGDKPQTTPQNPSAVTPAAPQKSEKDAPSQSITTKLVRAKEWFVRGTTNIWKWLNTLLPESSFHIEDGSASGPRG